MKTSYKKISAGFLTMIMTLMLLATSALASTPLKNGNYTISVQAVNATTGAVSNADSAIKKPVKLEVKDNKIFVILEMNNNMYDLGVQNSAGGFDLAEEIAENEAAKTYTYKFQVQSIDEPVLMETVVAAMGMKVKFKLAFDKATLAEATSQSPAVQATATQTAPTQAVTSTSPSSTNNAATANSTVATNVTTKTTANSNVSNPKTGDNTFTNLISVILTAAVASLAIIGVSKIKIKKQVQG